MELFENTKVLMADGSERLIRDIRIGDRIGLSANVVADTITGISEKWISIKTKDDVELRMGINSFIEVEKGVVLVSELRISDSVRTTEGFLKLAEIKEITGEDRVYLSLCGDKFLKLFYSSSSSSSRA